MKKGFVLSTLLNGVSLSSIPSGLIAPVYVCYLLDLVLSCVTAAESQRTSLSFVPRRLRCYVMWATSGAHTWATLDLLALSRILA